MAVSLTESSPVCLTPAYTIPSSCLGHGVDWFTEWPAEALKGVAMAMMTETDLELGSALDGIVEMFR